ncbi:hypothetical protein RvY_06842 [Ramazzottius varieornatus]|uniref:Peptidase S1 domain-containing protein n=1 Tax=Ramazzottius varieornatus TaxID=947166 RepID=A0A1D1V393_RAMVA|nr:hypothetical protein RvY_06842 [Ramazzottius varieornatus]
MMLSGVLFTVVAIVAVTAEEELHCGQPAISGLAARNGNRIINGQDVTPNSVPWQAAFLKASSKQQICSASIISDRWLLTAAHCCKAYGIRPSTYAVTVGAHNLKKREDTTTTHTLSHVIVQPGHQNGTQFSNDMCLVKTTLPMVFTDAVSPVCLADVSPAVGDECIVTGWGDTVGARPKPFASFEEYTRYLDLVGSGLVSEQVDESVRGPSNTLKSVSVNVVDSEECGRGYPTIPIGEDMLCAGNDYKGSCRGDSGGPLVRINEDGHFDLVGVVSWGAVPCAPPGKPGVFSRVTHFREWIESTMAAN